MSIRLARRLGAEAQFAAFARAVLLRALATIHAPDAERIAQTCPVIAAELDSLRARLSDYEPEYLATYASVLERLFTQDELAQLDDALSNPLVARLVGGQSNMSEELARATQLLSQRMNTLALYGDDAAENHSP